MSDIEERYRRSGSESFGTWGSASEHKRYMVPKESKARRRCPCCKRRATHYGMANGVTLISGCEWAVAKWVRNPNG